MDTTLALDISTRVYGGARQSDTCVVHFSHRILPLRDVIAEKVRAEVARAAVERTMPLSTRYLVEEDLATVRGGATPYAPRIRPEHEIESALDAFRQGHYFVIVDGERVDDLDTAITLQPRTMIDFLRVLPLIGG
jgi:hypothetical protein